MSSIELWILLISSKITEKQKWIVSQCITNGSSAKNMDVQKCSTKSQAMLYNLSGHYYLQILIASLTVYSSELSQVGIYSEKSLLGPLNRYGPQILGPSGYLYNNLLKIRHLQNSYNIPSKNFWALQHSSITPPSPKMDAYRTAILYPPQKRWGLQHIYIIPPKKFTWSPLSMSYPPQINFSQTLSVSVETQLRLKILYMYHSLEKFLELDPFTYLPGHKIFKK